MNVFWFLVVGLLAGWIASIIMKGHGLGTLGDIVVGIVGALIGGFVFDLMGVAAYGFWPTLGMALIGSIILLTIISLVPRLPEKPLP